MFRIYIDLLVSRVQGFRILGFKDLGFRIEGRR